MKTEKRIFGHIGYLQIVERLKNSPSGNPAYSFMVGGLTLRTKPNSSLEHYVKEWAGKHVSIKYSMNSKDVRVLESIDLLDAQIQSDNDYIEAQFKKLSFDDNFNGSVQVRGTEGKTNFMNITAAQAATISLVLRGLL